MVALPLVAAACVSIQSNVTLYGGQRWKAEVRMTIPPQTISMLGSEEAVDAEMQKSIAKSKQDGDITYKWRKEKKDGSLIYTYTAQGTGWADLNSALFSGSATIVEGPKSGQVYFRKQVTADESIMINPYGLRLTGGKIVSSNADEVKGNTAIWYNLATSEYAEAVLTEAPSLPGGVSCPAGAILVFFAATTAFLSRGRVASSSPRDGMYSTLDTCQS